MGLGDVEKSNPGFCTMHLNAWYLQTSSSSYTHLYHINILSSSRKGIMMPLHAHSPIRA